MQQSLVKMWSVPFVQPQVIRERRSQLEKTQKCKKQKIPEQDDEDLTHTRGKHLDFLDILLQTRVRK